MEPTDWKTRWPSFTPEEIYSPLSLSLYRHKLNPIALDRLQALRNYIQKPILVNHNGAKLRGVRTISENHKIADSGLESMHVAGCAFDISTPSFNVAELVSTVLDSGLFTGIGIYQSWVHVDLRFAEDGKLTFWDNR